MCGYEVTELKSSGLRDELSSLIKATNDMFLDDGCEDEENDTFMMEFRQRKIDYYSNKMGLGEVTEYVSTCRMQMGPLITRSVSQQLETSTKHNKNVVHIFV